MRDPPAAVLEEPCDRLAQARSRRSPAAPSRARARILRRVDGIAQVVPGPVLDEGDQLLARADAPSGASSSTSAQIVRTTSRLVFSLLPPTL